MKEFYGYIFLLFTLIGHSCIAQSFSTKVSARTIGKNDRLQVEYIANNGDLSNFKMPTFNGWVMLSGPNMTSNQTIAGNVVTQQIIYSFTLVPKVPGKLVVPGASALLNKKPVRTNPISIEVKNVDHVQGSQRRVQHPAAPFSMPKPAPKAEMGSDQFLRPGESARDKIDQNILVKAEANKRTAVVGEPILITYKLCTRLRSQSKVVSQPSFTGATVIEMTAESPMPAREMVDGKMYNVYIVRRVQLIPLQEGPLIIPEAAVENEVAFYDAASINYRDLYYNNPSLPVEEVTVTTKNKPITIDIKPLPPLPATGPEIFSGVVGSYNISAAPAKSTLETNTTNYLVVVIVGEGNSQQMRPPVINWPNGIEGFEPKIETNDDEAYFPVRSRKAFTYPFVVNKPGNYTLPPISFTYFNPETHNYVTKKTVPLPLLVSPGIKKEGMEVADNTAGNDFQNRLIILIGAGLLAVIIGLVWLKDRNRGTKNPPAKAEPVNLPVAKIEQEQQDTSKYIYQIRELWPNENTSVFYKALCKNVHSFIEGHFKIAPSQLKDYMLAYSGDIEPLESLQEVLDHCSLGMYTPLYTIEEALQHRLQAIETLSKIDRDWASFNTQV